MLLGICDLKDIHFSIPVPRCFEEPRQLRAQRIERRRVIGIEGDRAQNVGGGTHPVLERLLDEVGDRHHQPSEVPDTDHDVCERDVFDAPPLARYDDHAIHADGVSQSDLETGEQCGDAPLGCEANDDARDASRREKARAKLAPAYLVPVDLPPDAQPLEVEAVFFSSVDYQCLRHVLLLAVAGTARRAPSPSSGSSDRSALETKRLLGVADRSRSASGQR
jgi:hypothetical protein